MPKMKSIGQGFQKLEHGQDRETQRQTDRRSQTHYLSHIYVQ